jgi:hypothetical protein
MLNELFHGIVINGKPVISAVLGQERPTDNIVRSLLEISKDPAGRHTTAGVPLKLQGMEGETGYTLKVLNKDGEGNVKAIACKLTTDDYSDFFGTEDINLLFDASVIGVTAFIKGCLPGTKSIYLKRIINRELINDPAPKTYEEPEPEKKNPKVNFEIMFESNKDDITYARNSSGLATTNEYQRDKFFSNFDFRIGPISEDRKKLPKTSVDIISEDGKRIYNNDSPHENNNISNCWGRILQAFKKSSMKHVESSAYFQCKRSGDWLQALSCLDLGRKYSGKTTTVAVPLKGKKIILVTHDRVLLWYALFMGIDVLMTYKMPAEGATDDDSGDDDVESLGDDVKCDPTGSQRFMLYFSSDKRGEPPAVRTKRLLDTTDANIADGRSMPTVKTWIDNYNKWVQEIKTERVGAIDAVYQEVIAATPANMSKKLTSLVKAYYEYTSLDYLPITYIGDALLSDYNAVKVAGRAAVAKALASPAAANAAQIAGVAAAADAYLSYYNNMLYKSLSIPTKNSIIMSANAYKRDPLYEDTTTLAQEVTAGRGDRPRGGLTPQARAIATASYLSQRLSSELLKKLFDQMQTIKTTKLSGGKIYLIDSFLPHIMIAAAAAAPVAAAAAADVTAAIQEEDAQRKELVADAGGEAPATAAEIAATAAEEAADVADQGTGVRKIAVAMTSFGNAVRRFGEYIRVGLSGRLVRGFGFSGGGQPDAVTCQLFYALYMRQLMLDLDGFESNDDDDYQYYEALARMVVACSTREMKTRDSNFYNTMEAILYDMLPNGNWSDAEDAAGSKFIPNEQFAQRVAFVARQVALHSIDMATGTIDSLGNTGAIPAAAVAVYADLRTKMRPLGFEARKAMLLKELSARLAYPAQYASAGINAKSLPALKVGLPPSVAAPIKFRPAQTVGGRRRATTRKNRLTRKMASKKRKSTRRRR